MTQIVWDLSGAPGLWVLLVGLVLRNLGCLGSEASESRYTGTPVVALHPVWIGDLNRSFTVSLDHTSGMVAPALLVKSHDLDWSTARNRTQPPGVRLGSIQPVLFVLSEQRTKKPAVNPSILGPPKQFPGNLSDAGQCCLLDVTHCVFRRSVWTARPV